jgi:hypothetical protein
LETTVMVLVYPHQRWMWPWLCESLWLNMAHCPAWVVSSFVSRWSMWSSKPGAYSMFYTFELWATNLNGWLSHSNPRIDSIPYPTHIPFISHFSTYKNGTFRPGAIAPCCAWHWGCSRKQAMHCCSPMAFTLAVGGLKGWPGTDRFMGDSYRKGTTSYKFCKHIWL